MERKHPIRIIKDSGRAIRLLDDRLSEFNAQRTGLDNGSYFSRVVPCEKKGIIGGIAGWTWAGGCEITHLWVDESYRGQGIGKMLLAAAEEEARSKGCRMVLLRSFSFQAPSFYEKQGYRTKHIINNFPAGHRFHTLMKEISPDTEE